LCKDIFKAENNSKEYNLVLETKQKKIY